MFTHRESLLTSIALFLLLLVLSACGDATPTAAPTAATTTLTTAPATTLTVVTTTVAPSTAPATTIAVATTVQATTTASTTATTVQATTTTDPATATTVQVTTTVAQTVATTTTNTVTPATTTIIPATSNSKASYKIVVGKSDGSIQLFKSPQDFTNANAPIIGQGNSPIFSPDGKRIAFIAPNNSGDPASNSPIQSVKVDGTDLQTYCTVSYQHTNLVRWLPKPNYIIVGQLSIGVNTSNSCDLSDKSVKDSPVGSADSVGAVLDYAPDGKSFVWLQLADSQDGVAEIYYGNSTKYTQLTHGQNRNVDDPIHAYLDATISPDGKTIAIVSGDKGVFFMSVPGKTSPYAGKMIFTNANVSRLAWSPDGKQLLAVVGTDSGSIIKDYDFSKNAETSYTLSDAVWVDWAKS